ncbi:MAG: hypothetical protein EXR62_05825 [Chloroflexi bacterium]|nr:hypothetical protein [Chloroflexota bacterium]
MNSKHAFKPAWLEAGPFLLVILALLAILGPQHQLQDARASSNPSNTDILGTWRTIANGDSINAITRDANYLWVGTEKGGVVRWDLTNGTYRQFLYPNEGPAGLAGNTVRQIVIDGTGRKWFATNRGVSVLSADATNWEALYTLENTGGGLNSNQVSSIAFGADSSLWVGLQQYCDGGLLPNCLGGSWRGGGVARLKNGAWTSYKSPMLPSNQVNRLIVTRNEKLIVATGSHRLFVPDQYIGDEVIPAHWTTDATSGGVAIYDGSAWATFNRSSAKELGANDVLTVVEDPVAGVWFGTTAGISYLNNNSLTSKSGNLQSEDTSVYTIAFDAAKRVWVGHGRGGVSTFDGQNWFTYTIRNSPLTSNSVRALYVDKDQSKIWIGTHDLFGGKQGLNIMSQTGNTWTQFNTYGPYGLASDSISNLRLFQGDLYITTSDYGLMAFSTQSRNTYGTWTRQSTQNGLPSNTINNIYIDPATHTMFIGTNRGATLFINQASWKVLTQDSTNSGLNADNVRAVMPDKNNSVWFATDHGLFEWQTNPDFTDLTHTWINRTFNIGTSDIRDLWLDSAGKLWIATNSGLYTYEPSTGFSQAITSGNSGLVNNDVRHIYQDNYGRLWFMTAGGVTVKDNSTWTSYTTANGLLSNDVRSLAMDGWGRIWFATAAGASLYTGQGWINYTTSNSSLANNALTSVVVDSQDCAWLGTAASGISQICTNAWSNWNTASTSLASNNISAVAFTSDGGAYIGHTYRGINKLSATNAWSLLDAQTTNKGMRSNYVRALTVGANNRLWVGSQSYYDSLSQQIVKGGVFVLNNTSWTTYDSSNTGSNGLGGNYVLSLAIRDDNQVFVGTGGDYQGYVNIGFGVSVFNGTTWRTYTRSSTNNLLGADRVNAIAFTGDRKAVLGTLPAAGVNSFIGGGVSIYDDKSTADLADDTWTLYNNKNSSLVASDTNGAITAAATGPNNTIWAGGWSPSGQKFHWPTRSYIDGALNQFNNGTWSLQRFANSGPISGIVSDQDSRMWVGTWWKGIQVLDGNTWQNMTSANSPLNSDETHLVAKAPNGDIWIGTSDGGISIFHRQADAPTPTPTDTPTSSPSIPTASPTVPQHTPTDTATATPTAASPTSTAITTATRTFTPSPTGTPGRDVYMLHLPIVGKTFSRPVDPFGTPTATISPTRAATQTPSATSTLSSTPTNTATPVSTATPTSTSPANSTITATATATPAATGTNTATATATFTPSSTATATATRNPSQTAVAATWRLQSINMSKDLYDVFFLDANHGWISGASGALRRTSDGGQIWVNLDTIQGNIRAVAFHDLNNGWIAGDGGLILSTNNGGTTFNVIDQMNITKDFTSISIVSNNDVWFAGEGTLLHFINGNWDNIVLPSFDFTDIRMLGPNQGWATDRLGRIIKYNGATWESVINLAGAFNSLALSAGGNSGWAVGDRVLARYNGTQWVPQVPLSYNMYSISMLRPDAIWSVGQVGMIEYYNGSGWASQSTPTNKDLTAIQMLQPDLGWAVGLNATILKYSP